MKALKSSWNDAITANKNVTVTSITLLLCVFVVLKHDIIRSNLPSTAINIALWRHRSVYSSK